MMLQEAAAALQERLGDLSAVFLIASPEEGKVAMAAAVSPAAVAGGLQVRPVASCATKQRISQLLTLLAELRIAAGGDAVSEAHMQACCSGGRLSMVSKRRLKRYMLFATQAGKLVGSVAKLCGGGGGGRPNLAQAGGRQPEQIPEALEAARKAVVDALQTL